MGFLAGKRALIVGLASNRSIAWGVAKAMQREGAELAFTYQNEKLRSRVESIAAECGSQLIMPCDVADDAEIEGVFGTLAEHWTAWTSSFIRLPMRRAKHWRAAILTVSTVNASAWPTMSVPTVSLRSPGQAMH